MRRSSARPTKRFAAAGVLLVLAMLMVPMVAPAIGNGILSGPQHPPPGGATLTKSTCTNPFPDSNPPCEGKAGGRTLSYTAFDGSLFTDLWWSPTSAGLPQLSLNGTGGPNTPGAHNAVNLPFAGIDGGNPKIARWSCTSCIPVTTFSGGGFGTTNLAGRFTATITSAAPSGWTLASTLAGKGVASNVSVLLNAKASTSFAVNVLFEISTNGGTTWQPAIDYYNAASTDPTKHTFTSHVGGFFWNRPPVALNQAFTTNEDAPIATTLNVTDADANDLIYTITSPPSNGSLSGTAPNLTYTPAAEYSGPDSFSYSINDGFATASATVSLTVEAVNDAPVAVDQSVSTDEDTPVTFTISATDVDNAQEDLTLVVVDSPVNGQIDTTNLPDITYTPDPDFFGTDSITFDAYDGAIHSSPLGVVTITVNPVNDAPVATDDQVETAEDTPIAITLPATDIDNVLGELTFSIVDAPTNGTFDPAPDGSNTVTYVPNANFNGTDTFTFLVNDGALDSNIATITVTVTDVNDAPVADDQGLTTDEDMPLPVVLTASDVDNTLEELTFTVTEQPAHGTLTGTGAALLYTPQQDYNGTDSFKFVVNDGELDSNEATVSITINAVNDAPVADDDIIVETAEDNSVALTLTGFDVDTDVGDLTYSIVSGPANGTLTGSGTDYVYTPNQDYFGQDTFTFKINDGELDSNIATVTLNVTPVNDAPVADPQSVMTFEDTPLEITLTGSDVDNLPADLVFEVVDVPVNGMLSGSGAELVYTPFENYHGSDSFTFKISDGELDSMIVTVSIEVAPVNDNPVAGADVATTPQYTPVTFQVLGNDSDVDGDTITLDSAAPGQHGSTTVNQDGTITYTPNPTFKGTDTFTYAISDGNGGTGIGNVTIIEDGCGEDGIDALDGTPAEGAPSETIDKTVEPAVGAFDEGLAATLHDTNCTQVVPLEDLVDEAIGSATAPPEETPAKQAPAPAAPAPSREAPPAIRESVPRIGG